jgi:hypothetical protein
MTDTYRDIDCLFKKQNNELLATSLNSLTHVLSQHGQPAPTWRLLTLDGPLGRTTRTICSHAGALETNVTVVERDPAIIEEMKHYIPRANIVCDILQAFCSSDHFPSDYNAVYLDWMCTLEGNKREGPPLKALDDFLRRVTSPYIVCAQTFCLRGELKGSNLSGPPSATWERGSDTDFEEVKASACGSLAELALRSGYIPLWNLHFESTYRRAGKGIWMLFMSVVLWRLPDEKDDRAHWDIFNKNQVQIKNRCVEENLHIETKLTFSPDQKASTSILI